MARRIPLAVTIILVGVAWSTAFTQRHHNQTKQTGIGLIADFSSLGDQPAVKEALAALDRDGTAYALMGSVHTGIFVKRERAAHAQRLLRKLPHARFLHFTKL